MRKPDNAWPGKYERFIVSATGTYWEPVFIQKLYSGRVDGKLVVDTYRGVLIPIDNIRGVDEVSTEYLASEQAKLRLRTVVGGGYL